MRTLIRVGLAFLVACSSSTSGPDKVDTGGDTASAAPTGTTSAAAAHPESWDGGIADLFSARCAGCHSGDTPDAGLDLSGDLRTLDVASTQSDLMLLSPGDHLYSYLWHKVNGSQSVAGGSGTNMPIATWLDDADIERLAGWIDRGCP